MGKVRARILQSACIGALLAGMLGSGGAQASPVEDIRKLLDEGRGKDAYALARANLGLRGTPGYDYLLGQASIAGGQIGEGVLALERYLLANPADDRARLELARGYYLLGEYYRAREEFEDVAKQNPPAEVRANIDKYLDAIRAAESAYTPSSSVYVEVGGGYDSNVNGGVKSLDSYLFFGQPLPESSGPQKSYFRHVAMGGQYYRPLMPGLALFVAGTYDGKYNNDSSDFNLETMGGAAGLVLIRGNNVLRLTASVNNLSLGGNRYRETQALGAEVRHQIDATREVNIFLQHADMTYTDLPNNQGGVQTNSNRNATLTVFGGGYQQAFQTVRWQPVVSGSLSYGEERNVKQHPQYGRGYVTASLNARLSPAPKWAMDLGYTYQNSLYDGMAELPDALRRDNFKSLTLGGSYFYDKRITVRGEIQRSDTWSNVGLYSNQRTVTSLNVRYDFK